MRIFIILLIFGVALPGGVYSFSGNGSGTEEDPYQITNVHQLQEMKDDLSAHYILMNDIDASETREWNVGDHDNDPETPDSAMGFEPVGRFIGSLDGKDFAISDLYINRLNENGVGLFGSINDNGYVQAVHIKNAYVIGGKSVGIFVGILYAENSEVNIENCSTSGFVSGISSVGGFCGFSNSQYGKVSIMNSYSTANVIGTWLWIGGFCGENDSSKANGYVKISNSYAIGDVTGIRSVGGFCGKNDINYSGGSIFINDSYSTGNATGESFIGGFCGENDVEDEDSEILIERCYSYGIPSGYAIVGGFCGSSIGDGDPNITNCYWDTQTSEISESKGGIGKTTDKLKQQETFETWDFIEVWNIDPEINHGYPFLSGLRLNSMPLKAPALIYPHNELIIIEEIPDFSWIKVIRSTDYTLQLSLNESFSSTVIDTILTATSFSTNMDLSLSTDYFWRVKAQNINEESKWSQVNKFKIVENDINENFSGLGSGTKDDPFQITNVHQLQEMNDDLDAHYILMNDIDASETKDWNIGDTDKKPFTPDSAMGFDPVGTWTYEKPQDSFCGNLDGQNYIISNLTIYRPNEDYVGLFGSIGDGGNIYRVHIENAEIKGDHNVGALTGVVYAHNKNKEVSIDSCSSSGKVVGQWDVGVFSGSAGSNLGACKISNSYAKGYASGDRFVGGFSGGFGTIYGTTIVSNSYAICDVSGQEEIGGFAGRNFGNYSTSTIIDCYAAGSVDGSNKSGGFCGENNAHNQSGKAIISKSFASLSGNGIDVNGGFCGINSTWKGTAMISYCYSTTSIDRGGFVGGFCGENEAHYGISIINDCYSAGNIINAFWGSGFCGRNVTSKSKGMVKIERCYRIGMVSSENEIAGFCSEQGGSGKEEIISSYWDTQTSEIDSSDGGEGKTTAEMMMQSTFVDWDFDNVWCMVEGKTYPQLQHFVDCDTLVSVEDIKNDVGIEIYPNPSDEIVNISSERIVRQLKIINVLGKIVKEEKNINQSSFQIDVGKLPQGYYLIQLYYKNEIVTYPIIIK
jgi:hypothetical protein